jgi:hypothetical protein
MSANLMNKKETKLLVEDWRRLLTLKEEDELLEESFLRYAPLALGMLSSFLGGLAGTSTANAMPPEEIANQLHVEFNKKYPGVFEIYTDDRGRVVGFREETDQRKVILTEPQCENIDEDEFKRAINALRRGSSKDYSEILNKAAESSEDEDNAQRNVSKEKRDIHARINDISSEDKDRILDEYFEGWFEFNMDYNTMVTASQMMMKKPPFNKYKSWEYVMLHTILKHNRSYRRYLPAK